MNAEVKPPPGKRVRDLFLGALERPDPADRAAFLRETCGDDGALRQQVEALLAERAEVGDFLEAPAMAGERAGGPPRVVGPRGTEYVAPVSEGPGDFIDRYKLLQRIGEGGCGVVYMAEQEEPVRRRVALKIIKLGMDTRSVIARFEAERQALAMMDHPNIARVLDAGATETGRPFFVMELVRGIRITDYCDEHNLGTAERIKLFVQVCQAIQHAHQKGIIHRDVKPSNILVTLHDCVPVPKVIDFGIAKATEQRLTEKTLFTEFQSFIGTPAYMSPEQALMSGLDIDTRSDIYSLGVLLYELLTGRTPFDAETLHRAGLDECRRTIREVEPARPSNRIATLVEAELTTTARHRHTEPAKLIHVVRGDLDWIVMKCLEKDRTRRYATANDLAADLHRYLEGDPVSARPPSGWYRFQKFARRHRGVIAATAAVAVTLIGGAGISAWLAVRATKAEKTALASERQEAELRRQAEQEREAAESERRLARLNEYVADINLAQQSLVAGNYGRAVQLLDKHRPEPGESDLRGFEWRYLWRLSRGDEHGSLPTQEGGVHSLAVSPGGDVVAIGLREKFSTWNLVSRSRLAAVPKGGISMAFTPNGQQLMTASFSTVRVWGTKDWTEVQALPDHAGTIALSSDGTRLATVKGENRRRAGVSVVDTATWTDLRLFPGASDPVAFSPDGTVLVTDAREGLTLWPMDESRPKVVLQDSTNLFSRPGPWFRSDRPVAFSPDGKLVVAARNTLSDRGVFVLSVWEAETGREVGAIPSDPSHIEHAGMITCLAFSPDRRTLATASMDHSVRLWDFNKRQPIAALQGHLSEVWALAFSPDGQTLLSGSKDGEVKIWPVRSQRRDDVLTGVRHPLAFSKDGRTLACLTRDGSSVVFLNLATGEPEHQFQVETRRPRSGPFGAASFGPPPSVGLSEDLRTLACGQEDGAIKLWNTVTRESTTLKVSGGPAEVVWLSPDGERLLTRSGRDRVIHQWDMRHGTNRVWAAEAFRVIPSPNGRLLATFGRGNVIELWDAVSLSPVAKLMFEEQLGFGATACFSADSRHFAVAYQDDVIRIWEVSTGKLAATCTGHKQDVRSVAFSPDSKTLITASDDSTLKIWNVATGQELLTIRRLGATLTGLMFSPDGRLLVGGSGAFSPTGGVQFYRAPTFDEIELRTKGQNVVL